MKKNGRRNGVQRYLCRACRHPFQSARRPIRWARNLWRRYATKGSTATDLAEAASCSARTIRRVLVTAPLPRPFPVEKITPVVLVIDTTYFGAYGVMVFRCATRKQNLLWSFVTHETNTQYLLGIAELERRGFQIVAVVCDGKRWLCTAIVARYPVQHCLFHMMRTVTRYLTRNPLLPAGQELRALSLTLCRTDKETFVRSLDAWHGRWDAFLHEKTINPLTHRWVYTHRRIYGAYGALMRALPYLFTYEDHPHLAIPKTTNTLDGFFSHLKHKMNAHRGLSLVTHQKMISTLLGMPTKTKTATNFVH